VSEGVGLVCGGEGGGWGCRGTRRGHCASKDSGDVVGCGVGWRMIEYRGCEMGEKQEHING
jgi:hypothetical protein